MKNFKIKLIAFLLVVATLMLVGCKKPDQGNTPDGGNGDTGNTETPAYDAAATVAGFASKVEGTVKLTYVTNYKVDVVREGADASGMASFMRDVVATTVVEMDLTDLYIKVTKTRQDKLIDDAAIKTEEILFQKDGKYYYQTSSSAAVEVADAAAKLAEIFENATYEQVGGLSLDALVYNKLDKTYELKVFALSDTFLESELADPTYAEGANGGLKVTYAPDYVGYRTDGGWSDFPGAGNTAAANVEILTNDKGYVTSMKETYNNASLVFNIMSNPPTVTINGERSFTATYGEAITKVDSVELSPSKAAYEQANGGSFVVMTCPMGQFSNMAPVANGGDLVMGNIICVKPTANEGYELVKVVVNGSETPMINPAQAGGFYCFNVAPGTNTIEVMFRSSDPTVAVVDVKNNAGVNYMLQSFTYGANGPEGYTTITDGVIQPGNSIFGAILVTSNDEVVVTVNGTATSINIPVPTGTGTYYCFSVKEGGKYDVVISKPGQAVEGNATVNVTNNAGCDYQLQSFNLVGGAPDAFVNVENGVIEPGQNVWGAIVVAGDASVSVTVNGNAPGLTLPNGGKIYFCFSVKEGGEINIVINAA